MRHNSRLLSEYRISILVCGCKGLRKNIGPCTEPAYDSCPAQHMSVLLHESVLSWYKMVRYYATACSECYFLVSGTATGNAGKIALPLVVSRGSLWLGSLSQAWLALYCRVRCCHLTFRRQDHVEGASVPTYVALFRLTGLKPL
jgi:hypothetical protein